MSDAAEQAPTEPEAESADGQAEDQRRGRDAAGDRPLDDEDELAGSGLGHDEQIVSQVVSGRTVFTNPHIIVEGNFLAGGENLMVPIADVTQPVREIAARFVAPGCFDELLKAISETRVVALSGASCGKRTAAEVALQRAGHDPILQLPAGIPVRDLVDGIERAVRKNAGAGIVIDSIDPETLVKLTGFEARRMGDVLGAHAAVVLTVHAHSALPIASIDVPVVECLAPDLRQVIANAEADEAVRTRALKALDLLDAELVSPGAALALLQAAKETLSCEELAQAFAGQTTEKALTDWLSDARPAEHVAALVAGAILFATPISVVDDAAERLSELFARESTEASEGPRTFGVASRGWPADVLALARGRLTTHFGRQEAEVVEVRLPHSRERILGCLWRQLGPDFRAPLCVWLRELADHRSAQVRRDAAIAAGILFTEDPVAAEAELLRPWALDERFARRVCAAIALGVPVAVGRDPTSARALARAWAASSNRYLCHVAVLAYGGLLGAWDAASAAPAQLWRIGAEQPALERSANLSLAALVAAGGPAGVVRATVLGILQAQASLRPPSRRAYRVLPLILKSLLADNSAASDSLKALLDEEAESLRALGALLAQAFDYAAGYQSAVAALDVLLEAIAESRVEERAAFRIMEETLGAAPGDAEELRAQIERPLWAHARKRGAMASAAQSMLTRLFHHEKERSWISSTTTPR